MSGTRAVKTGAGSASRGRGRAVLRALPQIDLLLSRPEAVAAAEHHGRPIVAALVRAEIDGLRQRLGTGALAPAAVGARVEAFLGGLDGAAAARTASTLRGVVNATGVILHTNLGRAVLSEAAARRMVEVARAYTTLEYDLGRGGRGSRGSHLERILTLLFPGRGTHVVNNNAGAVLLALNTLADGKEAIVSRGELVEIGGSFRIPDILRKSGAILREVGTTNKTRLADYARAIGPKTGLLLKVHPSNYRIVGFTAQAPLKEVAALGRKHRLPVLMDQGSGNLLDLRRFGVRDEPSAHDLLAEGADVVAFSGDKLLGGPQAGILVGRADLIKAMRENPLSRALRVDKVTAAALEATLVDYARGRESGRLPVVMMLSAGRDAIERRAVLVRERALERAGDLEIETVAGVSLLGGGSAPDEGLPTTLLAVRSGRLTARRLEERLRAFDPPVIARIEGGKVLIDLRTVLEEQDPVVAEALVFAAGGTGGGGAGGGTRGAGAGRASRR
ncbi:MAG: L-seryl-tRNA(Sec) selenium transferase [Candidatus Polarisedimenticolia bacterium]